MEKKGSAYALQSNLTPIIISRKESYSATLPNLLIRLPHLLMRQRLHRKSVMTRHILRREQ